jgi:predicted DNA-binding mobile mystery protein A
MSKRGAKAKLRRRELDRLFQQVRQVDLTPPQRGWIADVRQSLGISGVALARRLGVSVATTKNLEDSEAKRTITLSSLDRAAEALGCKVSYVLVPNKPLEAQIQEQALKVAHRLRSPVAHSMGLEAQSTDSDSRSDQDTILADELIATLDRSLWEPEP